MAPLACGLQISGYVRLSVSTATHWLCLLIGHVRAGLCPKVRPSLVRYAQ